MALMSSRDVPLRGALSLFPEAMLGAAGEHRNSQERRTPRTSPSAVASQDGLSARFSGDSVTFRPEDA